MQGQGQGPGSSPARLDPATIAEAARVLARAFADDPVTAYITGGDTRRVSHVDRILAADIDLGLRRGEVHVIGSIDGVAVWLPPGSTKITSSLVAATVLRTLASRLIPAALALGWSGFRRLNRLGEYADGLHARVAPGPHWYLSLLGIDPSRQGRGLGGALIAPMLERADAGGLPCCLESTNERNLGFYRRHGFEVAIEGRLPGEDLRIWAMVRNPRRPAS